MIRKLSLRGALALVAVVAGACASAPETGTNATEQLRFGVEMARRGLRPSGPLVRGDMLRRLEVVELARTSVEVP